MSTQSEASAKATSGAPLSLFERYLTLWVLLCIVAGTAFGQAAPEAAQAVGALEIAHVNIPVGLLIWVMIIPMLMKIDFGALHEVREQKVSMGITLLVNWLVKPFTMALLGWFFLRYLFAPWLPAEQIDSYIAGLILLGAAPCTAMVFVWSNLCRGNANFTLTQVALNDLVMVFAFAPIVALLLGVASIPVPWDTLTLSVVMYIVIPLAIAQLIRARLLRRGRAALDVALARVAPFSILALLATLVLLFSFQGGAIIDQPLIIAMLAVPLLLQTIFIAALGYWLNRKLRVRHDIAGPSTMIGASNFFELAVAVAIVLYGFNSGAALATVVGVLIEVPVMLMLVQLVNRSKGWYEQRPA
jgi:ACR3 family arsenite transporter